MTKRWAAGRVKKEVDGEIRVVEQLRIVEQTVIILSALEKYFIKYVDENNSRLINIQNTYSNAEFTMVNLRCYQ